MREGKTGANDKLMLIDAFHDKFKQSKPACSVATL